MKSYGLTIDGAIADGDVDHLVSKGYVDGQIVFLPDKQPAVCATTGNITLSGLQLIDGHQLVAGERILVKNQTDATQNGIYVASATNWSRAIGMDSSDELFTGLSCYIESGITNGGLNFILTTPNPMVLGTTNLTFVSYFNTMPTGAGFQFNGNQLSLTSILSSIANLPTNVTGRIALTNGVASVDTTAYLTGNQTITLSGDITGSGNTSISTTLASQVGLTPGSYNSVTVNSKGLVTSASSVNYRQGVVTSVSSDYSVPASTSIDRVVLVSGGAVTITLPAASQMGGNTITVKKISGLLANVTIVTAGSETIDGASSVTMLTQYEVKRLATDGTNWFLI